MLASLGLVATAVYLYYFVAEERAIHSEFILYVVWLVWALLLYVLVPPVNETFFWRTLGKLLRVAPMFFAISGLVARSTTLTPAFLGFVLGGIIQLVGTLLTGQVMSPDVTEMSVANRISGLFYNPNGYGYAMFLAIVGVTYFWSRLQLKLMRAILVLLGFAFLWGIVLSASRKAFLGLEVYLLAWSWTSIRQQIRDKPWLLLVLVLILLLLVGISEYVYEHTYMGVRYRMLVEDHSLLGHKRSTLYSEGFRLIKQSPILGHGLGQFAAHSTYQMESHSDYVEVYVSTGLFGFLMYFGIYGLMAAKIRRYLRGAVSQRIVGDLNVLRASLVTILVLAFFRHNITSIINWVFVAVVVGYLNAVAYRDNRSATVTTGGGT